MDNPIEDAEYGEHYCTSKRIWRLNASRWLFVRVLQGGRVTHRVHDPGRHAVACQLGGPDGRTLFCLTVAANLDDYPNRQQTARVETTSVDVPGAASSIRFAEFTPH
jgi:sugar lactone lactonase YvrE